MFPFQYQGNARLTFAFVAASSFSSHAFSTVVSASIAFQFFSRRSCGNHTERAISHMPCQGPQRCHCKRFQSLCLGNWVWSGVFHPMPTSIPFSPVFPVAPHPPLLWQCPGWGKSYRCTLRMPAEDTGQVQGCKVASTQVTTPCSRGIRSR